MTLRDPCIGPVRGCAGYSSAGSPYTVPRVQRDVPYRARMLFQSLFPALQGVPELNVHEFIFNSFLKDGLVDYHYLVDADTGRPLSSHAFVERVRDGATALQAPAGLGLLKDTDLVGIVSENCVVSTIARR